MVVGLRGPCLRVADDTVTDSLSSEGGAIRAERPSVVTRK
jgi:hypothetical protein